MLKERFGFRGGMLLTTRDERPVAVFMSCSGPNLVGYCRKGDVFLAVGHEEEFDEIGEPMIRVVTLHGIGWVRSMRLVKHNS